MCYVDRLEVIVYWGIILGINEDSNKIWVLNYREGGRFFDGLNFKGKLLERNFVYLMKVLFMYFCMLCSISGYFIRWFLGEFVEEDK